MTYNFTETYGIDGPILGQQWIQGFDRHGQPVQQELSSKYWRMRVATCDSTLLATHIAKNWAEFDGVFVEVREIREAHDSLFPTLRGSDNYGMSYHIYKIDMGD